MITATNITNITDTVIYESVGESGITTLMICNHTTNADAIVNVWVVPNGDTKGNAHQILRNLTIVASDTFVMDMEKLVLSDGDVVVLQSNIGDTVNSVISSMAI
jgi:hypothetical protein